MRDLMEDEAERLGKTRWAIMNVWRPIEPVTRDALAMCDPCSVPDACLAETVLQFHPDPAAAESSSSSSSSNDSETRAGSGAGGASGKDNNENVSAGQKAHGRKMENAAFEVMPPGPDDRYRWFYAFSMQPDEALLLKIFDSSKREEVGKRSPHTSFQCDEHFGGPRQSLEVRCLVFWEDEV